MAQALVDNTRGGCGFLSPRWGLGLFAHRGIERAEAARGGPGIHRFGGTAIDGDRR